MTPLLHFSLRMKKQVCEISQRTARRYEIITNLERASYPSLGITFDCQELSSCDAISYETYETNWWETFQCTVRRYEIITGLIAYLSLGIALQSQKLSTEAVLASV